MAPRKPIAARAKKAPEARPKRMGFTPDDVRLVPGFADMSRTPDVATAMASPMAGVR
jgi:hypothetical protein